jgi:MoxR-like ATPase
MQINLEKIQSTVEKLYQTYSQNIIGQSRLFETLVIGLMSGSHILLESVPGLAKTRAAMVLAESISGTEKRIQFTPDLMPSDIIGNKIYNMETNTFTIQVGPIYGNIILADEINRAPAKVQSALLEAMQEKQLSIGGETIKLPNPFFVIATQNPIEQEGTYSLPEAQLDRFLMKDVLTYPHHVDEKKILDTLQNNQEIVINSVIEMDEIIEIQKQIRLVSVEDSIKQYIVSIVDATRNGESRGIPNANYLEFGASPRASIGFMTASQVVAAMNGRDYVTPDDIKSVAHRILRHRLILTFEAESEDISEDSIIDSILSSVPTP